MCLEFHLQRRNILSAFCANSELKPENACLETERLTFNRVFFARQTGTASPFPNILFPVLEASYICASWHVRAEIRYVFGLLSMCLKRTLGACF